jgi:hypothetical protein
LIFITPSEFCFTEKQRTNIRTITKRSDYENSSISLTSGEKPAKVYKLEEADILNPISVVCFLFFLQW